MKNCSSEETQFHSWDDKATGLEQQQPGRNRVKGQLHGLSSTG